MTKQTNPIPVAVYVRVSSDRQDMVLSIGGQLKSLKEYADNNGYVVVREFVDEAESGRNADRPQFRAMIAEANGTDAPFEAILVWKFSRFARSREHSVVFKSMLKRRNIRVISISESAEENPTGELLEGIIEIIDEFYSKNMAQDIMRGMREASARGFWITAFAPLGYRKEYVQDGTKRRTKLVLDPPADALVKRMFDMAEAGNSLLDIAKALNGEGFTTARGYRWMTTGVHKILCNEAYTGTVVWGRNAKDGLPPARAEGAFPEIVSREQFERVQKELATRAPEVMHPRRTASNYMLSGLLKCRTCRKPFNASRAKSGKYPYYICSSMKKSGACACDAPRLSCKKFEQRVIGEIREKVLTESNIRELTLLVADEMEDVESEARLKLDALDKELGEVRRAVKRLWHAVETSDMEISEILPRLREQQSRQESLEQASEDAQAVVEERRALLDHAEAIGSYAPKLGAFLEASDIAAVRSFLRSFVKEIVVGGDAFTIRYTLPVRQEGFDDEADDEEGLPGPVRPTVPSGAPMFTRVLATLVRSVGSSGTILGPIWGQSPDQVSSASPAGPCCGLPRTRRDQRHTITERAAAVREASAAA